MVSDFIKEAIDEYRVVDEAEATLRRMMKEDLDFRASDQWAADIKQDRLADGRPCLTINRIPQFLRQVTNQQRATRPGIQVNPLDSGASVATAQAIQGVIRSIEENSDADVAYSTGCDHQVTMGRGFWRVLTEYADDDGFEQVIVIRRVPNPFTVFLDPSYIRADAADARFCIIVEDIPKNTFERLYGKDALASINAFGSAGNRVNPSWNPEGSVRVGERYYKVYEEERIVSVRMPDVNNPDIKQVVRLQEAMVPKGDLFPHDWEIVDKRTIERVTVKWAKFSLTDILDGNDDRTDGRDVPSKYIPVVQVTGDEINVDGKRDFRGMVRDAKDPQSMYSYWASAMTEQIALAPRAPYIGAVGFMRGQENKWKFANRKNYAALEYVPVNAGGLLAPPPQRQQFSADVSSIVEAFKLADNDLKAVMGLYDASLGESGPEQSGKAILARQRQGEVGNSNYLDNLGRAIRHTGRIILDMIPRVYTPIRVLRVLGVDDQPQKIAIHVGAPEQDVESMRTREGVAGIYDISVGRYDVAITSGPSFTSRRQEAVQSMLQLVQAYPEALPLIGDLMVKNMDWPGAAEIAARFKRMVPAQALDTGDGGGDAPIPPEVVAQLKAQIEQLTQELQTKSYDVQAKERMAAADRQLKERIADMDAKIEILKVKVAASADQASTLADAQLAEIQHRDRMIQEHNANLSDLNHKAQQGEADRTHAADQAELDRQHEATLQQQQLDAQPPTPAQ